MLRNNVFPNQRVTWVEKQEEIWYRPCYDYLISKALRINNKIECQRNLNAANGIIDESTYKYVLKPFNKIDDNLNKKLPGEIRNVDFITPIKEKCIGEYLELPYDYQVTTNNVDIVLKQHKDLSIEMEKLMQQAFINKVNEVNETGVESKEVPNLETFKKEYLEKWIEDRAIRNKHILNLLNDETDFEVLRAKCFFYWWATEEFYTYRYIENGQVRKEIINPIEGYPIDNGEEFVEDMDGFVQRDIISFTNIVDHKDTYGLSEYDLEILEDMSKRYVNFGELTVPIQIYNRKYANTNIHDEFTDLTENINGLINRDGTIWRNRICFKTQELIKVLVYKDIFGNEVEREVDENYVFNPSIGDIAIKEEWRNTVIYGYRFGDDRFAIYTQPRKELVQRRDMNNSSICKLPYGGKKGLLNGIFINPIPRRLLPYLALFRIYTLQQERTIAKHQAEIRIIPQSMINPDVSGTTDEKMFFIKADNTLIYDDTNVDLQTAVQGMRVIGNDAVAKYLSELNQIRRDIVSEAYELVHMNDARVGNTKSSKSVGNNQQDLYNARLGSVLMINMFNKALEKEHMADLEYSKVAWINGHIGTYIDKHTQKPVVIEVNPEEHLENDYGIFVRNSIIENAKLKAFRELAFNASQNGEFEMASTAIEGTSPQEIKRFILDHAKAKRDYDKAMASKEQELTKYQIDKKDEIEQRKIDKDIKVAEINKEAKIEAAQIGNSIDIELPEDTSSEDSIKHRNLNIKEKEVNEKNIRENRKLTLQEKKLKMEKDKLNKKK